MCNNHFTHVADDIDSTYYNVPQPPILPLEIQLLIIDSLYSTIDLPGRHFRSLARSIRERLRCLRAWSLVCRAWRSPCQACLLSVVYVDSSTKLDQLFHALRPPSSSRLARYVQRMHIGYSPPYHKIGEVLLRVISMRLFNLVQIAIGMLENDGIHIGTPFPLHPSLLAQASQLQTIRHLSLYRLNFRHLSEFRRFLSVFRGVESVVLEEVDFGQDEMGDLRSLHQTIGVGLRQLRLIGADPSGDAGYLPYPWIVPFLNPGFTRLRLLEGTEKIDIRPVITLSVSTLFRDLIQQFSRTTSSDRFYRTWKFHLEDECQSSLVTQFASDSHLLRKGLSNSTQKTDS